MLLGINYRSATSGRLPTNYKRSGKNQILEQRLLEGISQKPHLQCLCPGAKGTCPKNHTYHQNISRLSVNPIFRCQPFTTDLDASVFYLKMSIGHGRTIWAASLSAWWCLLRFLTPFVFCSVVVISHDIRPQSSSAILHQISKAQINKKLPFLSGFISIIRPGAVHHTLSPFPQSQWLSKSKVYLLYLLFFFFCLLLVCSCSSPGLHELTRLLIEEWSQLRIELLVEYEGRTDSQDRKSD